MTSKHFYKRNPDIVNHLAMKLFSKNNHIVVTNRTQHFNIIGQSSPVYGTAIGVFANWKGKNA